MLNPFPIAQDYSPFQHLFFRIRSRNPTSSFGLGGTGKFGMTQRMGGERKVKDTIKDWVFAVLKNVATFINQYTGVTSVKDSFFMCFPFFYFPQDSIVLINPGKKLFLLIIIHQPSITRTATDFWLISADSAGYGKSKSTYEVDCELWHGA